MTDVRFDRRPGGSPAIAAVLALEPAWSVRRMRIIDLGCGNGEDSLLIAAAGAHSVLGIDDDDDCIAVARRRARRRHFGNVTFESCRLPDALEALPPASCDVVVDTLAFDNIARRQPRANRLVRAIAHVLVDGGRWIIHLRRSGLDLFEPYSAVVELPAIAARYFQLDRVYPTHIAEHPSRGRGVRAAHVLFTVARRHVRRSRR